MPAIVRSTFLFHQFVALQEQDLREEMESGLRDRCVEKSPSPSQVRSLCYAYIVLHVYLLPLCSPVQLISHACIMCLDRTI